MSDKQLQLALAKMLPGHIEVNAFKTINWDLPDQEWTIQETEWLHVCWLIEQSLTGTDIGSYITLLGFRSEDKIIGAYSASWQQRAQALCELKRIK